MVVCLMIHFILHSCEPAPHAIFQTLRARVHHSIILTVEALTDAHCHLQKLHLPVHAGSLLSAS